MAPREITHFFLPKPKGVPEAAEEGRWTHQAFIDAFWGAARQPARGGLGAASRVLVYGPPHQWGPEVTRPLSELPPAFSRFCAHNKLEGFNSVTVQFFDGLKKSEDWHFEGTRGLRSGEVTAVFFSLKRKYRACDLGRMEFRFRDRSSSDRGAKKVKAEAISHGKILRLDAFKHRAKGCDHRLVRGSRAGIAVTLRELDPSNAARAVYGTPCGSFRRGRPKSY
jgi:hypothetical protein